MDSVELRLECLRLAVEFGSARPVPDPVDLAQKYMEVLESEDKPARAPRRKRVSDAE